MFEDDQRFSNLFGDQPVLLVFIKNLYQSFVVAVVAVVVVVVVVVVFCGNISVNSLYMREIRLMGL